MLTELMARSLREDELANRLVDHDDPAARELAKRFLGGGGMGNELEETKRELYGLSNELEEEQLKSARLEALLSEVLDEDCELPADLLKRIQAEV